MKQHDKPRVQTGEETKVNWQDPKLSYVQPKLTRQGDFNDLTAGFFGTFIPQGTTEG